MIFDLTVDQYARDWASFASRPFDHQDARFAKGVGDMFIAWLGVKEVPCFKMQNLFAASGPDMHVDTPVEDSEDFRAIVDVPAVGLVGPVQPHRRVTDPLDRQSVPG